MRTCLGLILSLAVAASALRADDPAVTPRPVPKNRTEIKQLLEDMKTRRPRIPLPELTDEERERLGERGSGYEARLRALYLPGGDQSRPMGGAGGGGREPDPAMTLDYPFKTMMFWIVSRTNNCQYCLGHQEWKLTAVGITEDQLGALDTDWGQFTPREQAAFAYARKITYEPHRVGDADIAALRRHFTDLQILEMTMSVSGNNAINRWKEGTGVPQSAEGRNFASRAERPLAPDVAEYFKTFLTPTPEKYRDKPSAIAPPARFDRPPLESRSEVERILAECARRKSRLPLAEDAAARELLPDLPKGPAPLWARLLANFPREGRSRAVGLLTAEARGDLSPMLKAQISWIIARQDRAWYAAGLARRRMHELGADDDAIFRLDGDWTGFSAADRALFTVARKLAAAPIVLQDADVELALKLTGPREVVQLINYVTHRAYFDRVTEAAGLPLDP